MTAEEFAKERHQGQKYGKEPYHVHLEAVVGVLKEFGFEEPYLAAGWLHDTVEDTATTTTDLMRVFGREVTELVWAVSGTGLTRRERNFSIYSKIRACWDLWRLDAASLKLADRLANVRASQVERLAGKSKFWDMYKREWDGFRQGLAGYGDPRLWDSLADALEVSRIS